MLVLGLESSCDETAASVVDRGNRILSNIVASQIVTHSQYGGIVPEIASRKHVEAFGAVLCAALEEANLTLGELSGIAVTKGPGLIGSLLVGLSLAKALSFACNLPFVGVNHLESHIAAIFLTDHKPEFPFAALVVSGGHTAVYHVRDFGSMRSLGQTRDDAAGEAFDKAAKMLGIGYPGGAIIDGLAKEGNRQAHNFPRAMKDSLDFSFSGVKTALLEFIKRRKNPLEGAELADLVASYQEAIVDVLVDKTLRTAELCSLKRLVICGGVAANSRLREKFYKEGARRGAEVFIPPPGLCTDNAAMVAALGTQHLKRGMGDNLELNAFSRSSCDPP